MTATGVNELMRDLAALAPKARQAGAAALDRVADRVVARARPRIPVDDEDGGQLRDSLRRTKVSVSSASGFCSVAVVVGGAPLEPFLGARKANVYAVIQHFDTSKRHDDGEALFLEKSVIEEQASIPDELEDALDSVLAVS